MKLFKDKTLILSGRDVQKVIKSCGLNFLMDTLIHRLRASIETFDSQKTLIPVRSGFYYEQPHSGLIEWMPLYKHGEKVMLKAVGYHPKNSDKFNLPTIISTISTYDTESGHLSALMDGVLTTALRTGAASAVASKFLAPAESSTLGLIGCGAQAVTQLHALSRIFRLREVFIYDIDKSSRDSFESRTSSLALDLKVISTDIEEVVRRSDILCTATTIAVGAGPLFTEFSGKPHLHINAVGSDFPGKIEIPRELLKNAFVCPDFIEQAVIEGECQQLSREDIDTDLAELVQNSDKFEFAKYQPSVFDSTGWALEDQVVMDLFLEYAGELGLGQQIEVETMFEEVKNPYHFLQDEYVSLDYDQEISPKHITQ